MSWYTDVYVGIQDKEGHIKPWGPYDAKGELHPIFTHSRSFTTDINEEFLPILQDNLTPELKQAFPYDCGDKYRDGYPNSETGISQYFGYLPAKDIPSGSFIKSGYYLIDDISQYLKDHEYFDGFYDHLTPAEYAMKLENELKFGKPKPIKDTEGYEIEQHSCSEYSYFSYPDYQSKEYDAFMMREAIEMLDDYKLKDEGYNFVIIKTEG